MLIILEYIRIPGGCMSDYDSEGYIRDLTDRVFLIKQEIEVGKIKISEDLIEGFILSFNKIRLRDDGRVDPSTVDSRIRAMSAAVNHIIERERVKEKYSIIDLQKAYFDILFGNFGDVYFTMKNCSSDPYSISDFFSKKNDYTQYIYDAFPDFFVQVKEFWKSASDIGIIHLQDGSQLKANFSGDLFPAYSENAVSTAGLYVDTISLPCPILRIGSLHKTADKAEFTRLLLKHVLTCMTYKDVILEEIEPAIALILPDRRDFIEHNYEHLMTQCEPYALSHAQYLYDIKFESYDEFRDFSKGLADIDTVLDNIKRPDRIIFDVKWGGDAKQQLVRLLSDKNRISRNVVGDHAGMEVFLNILGRMPQAYSAKINAQELGSTPYINAETSWVYYNWLIEYDSQKYDIGNGKLKSLHMMHALSDGMKDGFSWLGNVPVDKIIELRRNNLMEEIRDVLSSGVDKLIYSSPDNYGKTTQQVIDNIDRAFIEHQRVIVKAKRERLRIYGLDVLPCIASGLIAITGALTGNAALGTISAGLGIVGISNIRDIKSKFKERQDRLNTYQASVTGILFSHK